MNALIFDIGGTNLRLARTDGTGIAGTVRVPVPRTFAGVTETLAALGAKIAAGRRITAVAGGLAGPLDAGKTHLVRSAHLPFLAGKPFRRTLERLFRVPVLLENDNALAALGEATHGAGKGYAIVAYIGVGTGIGGCRIVDGAIDRNAMGFEPGHHLLVGGAGPRPRSIRQTADWESIVSGSALSRRFGTKAEVIASKRVWDDAAYHIALGLVNVTMFWSPDVLVVGGSLMRSVSTRRVRKDAARLQRTFPSMPVIRRGSLGDDAGLFGALEIVQRVHA